jgi:predicted dehydrogenase
VTLDYLRPEAATTHGEERVRIAGSKGVIETELVERRVTLGTNDKRSRTISPGKPADLFTQFARSLRGDGPPPLTLHEACRVTEVSLKAQQAAETGRVVSLRESPYRTT